MSERLRGIVEMIAATVISGTIGWFVLVSGMPVTGVIFWRCLIGGAVLLAVCYFRNYLRRDIMTSRQFLIAIIAGICLIANWYVLFTSYSHASMTVATVIYHVQPFILFLFGVVFFKERFTVSKIVWLLIAFAGVILLMQAKSGATAYGTGNYSIGITLALCAAFLYAVTAALTKFLKGVPPHLVALIQIAIGIPLFLPFAWQQGLPVGVSSWIVVAILGAVHTGIAYILLYGAIQKLPTNLVGAISFLYPVITAIMDYALLGYRPHPAQIVGIVVILFAAAGMTLGWSFRRNKVTAASDTSPAE